MTQLLIWWRKLFCKSSELGSTCTRFRANTYGNATVSTHSDYGNSYIFCAYRTNGIMWNKSMLYPNDLPSEFECLCSRTSVLSSVSLRNSRNLGSNKLRQSLCYSYTHRRSWDSGMFWRTSHYCRILKPDGSASGRSRRKLYCCCDATLWV